MLRFEHIEFLWALGLVPVFIFIFYRNMRWKRKALGQLGDFNIVKLNMPEISFAKPRLKFILFLVTYIMLILAISNPQIGTKMEEVKRKGSEIMILLDVSNSMLAQDMAPNRLENARLALSQLIDNLQEDRIGIIVFAGQAYVQMPLTTDYSAAKIFLNNISTGMVPVQGTAIGEAINMGLKSFDYKNGMSKSIIVITDGENHEDDAVSVAANAKDKGVSVHVIGLGSMKGAPIPTYKNGQQNGFITDSTGTTVISKLNEEMCAQIANAGGGISVHASNSTNSMNAVLSQIAKMQKKDYGNQAFKDFEDRFQLFLIPALLLLIIEFFIYNRKNRQLSKWNIFEVEKK